MTTELVRAGFEEAVYSAHFIKTIKHRPGRVLGTGALDLMNENLRARDALLVRLPSGDRYVDAHIEVMWAGWSEVMASSGARPVPRDVTGTADEVEAARYFGFNLACHELDQHMAKAALEPLASGCLDPYEAARRAEERRCAAEFERRAVIDARADAATGVDASSPEERGDAMLSLDEVFGGDDEERVGHGGLETATPGSGA